MRKTLLLVPALLLVPGLAFSEDLQVNLRDHRGRAIDGQVTATPSKGGTAKRCTTRGGRCTIQLAPGSYAVSGRSLNGGALPSKNVTVRSGRTASLTVQAPAPGSPQAGAQGGAGGAVAGSGGATRPGEEGGGGANLGSAPQPAAASGGSNVPAKRPAIRDLGSGRVAAVRGNTQDARGRPADGTVTFKQGRETIGQVRTRGGRFVAFDLAPGSYQATFRAASGRQGSANVAVRRGREVTVTIRVQ